MYLSLPFLKRDQNHSRAIADTMNLFSSAYLSFIEVGATHLIAKVITCSGRSDMPSNILFMLTTSLFSLFTSGLDTHSP